MQILGLPSDLACVLYRLERHSAHISDYAEHRPVGSADFILHTFYAHTHQLYPVLHPDFTLHFRESSAAGFPPSTMSCLSLLVASLAHISHDQTQSSPFEVALSMLSIVIQEHSVTSVHELSMHLSLSSIGGTMRGHLAMISLPTNTDVWDWSDDPHSLSRLSSSDGSHISEAYSRTEPPFHLSTEIQIQTVLNKYTSSRMDDLSASKEILDLDHPLTFALDMLCPSIAPDSPSQPISQHIDGAVCRAKYHLYEVSIYWPVIYRIIINGSADPELLPYAPLFFQSVTSLLGSANLALRICLPKTWFLCARAVEVRCLRLLCQPQFWEHIDASIDALHRPSMLSPSVLYMRESLKARLEGINIRYRA
ncbi:hypothetical protein N7530_007839 [Penicillium desertorum]|uniref:Transcription factor domain-containing protein n=1 Tax=Penicillium desertorum TaxID=1303715 RepID=A0A9X0BKP8_9EURO|nr:hypothetical protein N7530_007839 [Penicillium desertorum]